MAERACVRCGVRVGWVGAIVDAMLVAVKLLVGLETGSRALMADALYSLIDVLSALLVIGSFKIARKGADEDHAYGHGKIEYLAVAAVSIFIAALAVVLLHGAVEDLSRAGSREVHPMAAAASLFAVVSCYLVYRYARCAGTRLSSPVILTHAEHNKADAISSMAVLLSIVLSWVGLGMLDPIVALAEIAHVLYVSFRLFRRGVDGLLDAAPKGQQAARIAQIARQVPGVLSVEDVRARSLGVALWVELTVRVSPSRPMEDVSRIRALIRGSVRARVDRLANVMIEVLPVVGTAAPARLKKPAECEGRQ